MHFRQQANYFLFPWTILVEASKLSYINKNKNKQSNKQTKTLQNKTKQNKPRKTSKYIINYVFLPASHDSHDSQLIFLDDTWYDPFPEN